MAKDKDLRFVRTNQMLCNAFIELLSIKKFEDITVNELCEKALIRRATFYTHFLDKYDFFSYFVRQNRNDFVNNLPDSEEKPNLREFSIHMFHQIVHYLNLHMPMVQNAISSNAFSILLDILADEIQNSFLKELEKSRSEKLPDGICPGIAVAYYSGGVIQILRHWLTSKEVISEEKLVMQYSALLQGFRITE